MTSALHLKQAQRIIIGLIAIQGALLALMFSAAPAKLPGYLGFAPGLHGTATAWILATVITIAYVWSAATLSAVREWLFRFNGLKLLAIMAAVMAGVLEEVLFRKLVMDALMVRGFGPVMQVVASALAFGLAHGVWAFKSRAAGVNAVVSTTLLGAALAIVYIVGDRSLAPCVATHILITALIEPGLILAAVADRLGVWREKPPL
jgi:hypothetical protein